MYFFVFVLSYIYIFFLLYLSICRGTLFSSLLVVVHCINGWLIQFLYTITFLKHCRTSWLLFMGTNMFRFDFKNMSRFMLCPCSWHCEMPQFLVVHLFSFWRIFFALQRTMYNSYKNSEIIFYHGHLHLVAVLIVSLIWFISSAYIFYHLRDTH